MPEGERARWIVVVRADRAELYPKLRRSFEQAGWVEVIVDRRRGERRGRDAPPELDWRHADRRRAPGRSGAGAYRLAQGGDGFEVYEAEGPVPARCLDCGLTLEFGMPRFAEPPARLTLDVVHESVKVQHVAREHRHHVELQAFTATGRVLLAYRIAAGAKRDGDAEESGSPDLIQRA